VKSKKVVEAHAPGRLYEFFDGFYLRKSRHGNAPPLALSCKGARIVMILDYRYREQRSPGGNWRKRKRLPRVDNPHGSPMCSTADSLFPTVSPIETLAPSSARSTWPAKTGAAQSHVSVPPNLFHDAARLDRTLARCDDSRREQFDAHELNEENEAANFSLSETANWPELYLIVHNP